VEIAVWLRELGLGQHEQTFRDNAITEDLLSSLNDAHLRELGLPLGHRLKLLKAIASLTAANDDGVSMAIPPPHAPSEGTGERRQVTVVFADLAGFTELSSRLDSEDVHALLGRFFELVDRIVAEHGGHVDKHIGDCVMAVFGAPVAHGNDAERALRAALAAREAMPALSAEAGRALDVHIGVAGGQVVASRLGSARHREYTVTGETVNLASRLTDAAGAGEILVSEAVRRALAARFDGVETEKLVAKGFAAPVRAWRLHRLLAGSAGAGTPFVGRETQLWQLEAALSACLETGRGQTVHLRGEAGIGKTRLVEELRGRAEAAGLKCHFAHVLDFGAGSEHDAVRTLVRSFLDVDAIGGAGDLAAAVEHAGAHGLIRPEDAVFLNSLLGLAQPPELRALYDALDNAARVEGVRRTLASLVEGASRRAPRLLVVEDLHWADPVTRDHLATLAALMPDLPALLLLTSRKENDPLDAEWRARIAGAPLMTIELGPLRRDEALALAATFLETAERFVDQCLERAAGNPLFLEQLLRHAEESASDRVPGSVQNLVQARIDRLESVDKLALQAASVLGQRFDRKALRHLLGRSEYEPGRLVAQQIVRSDADGLLFAHALIRDAVYGTLLKSRRRELHGLAADWFAGRDAVLHAQHLDRAESDAAPPAYLHAARQQAAEYRPEMALRLAARGLELATAAGDRAALASLQGDILHDLGDMPGARQAYAAALDAADGPEARCRASTGLASVKRVTDDLDGAFADLQMAEAEALAENLMPERARIHFLRGNLCFPRGDWEGCLREHGAALNAARQAGLVELEAMALGGLGDAEYMCGRMISAHARFRECVELSEQHRLRRIEAANRPMMAVTRWFSGDARQALDGACEAIGAATRIGHLRARMIAHHAAWFCRHELMEFDAAWEDAKAALSLARQLGAHRFDAEALAMRAELHRLTGRPAEAAADSTLALDLCRRTGAAFLGPMVIGMRALLLEDRDEREAALQEGDALLRAGAVSHNQLFFGRDAIEASLGAGNWDAAERFAAQLEEYTRAEPLPWSSFYIARARALAAAGRGDRSRSLAIKLAGLLEEGERLGTMIALPRIRAALMRQGDAAAGHPIDSPRAQ
jgi:class 3 adenylate cyclase/tetratricopeptide (TPR) repeat protein